MKTTRFITMVVLALFASSLAAAASASAASTNNPGLSVTNAKGELVEPGASESKEVLVEGNGTQKLGNSSVTIECTKLKAKSGANLKGRAKTTEAGLGEGTLEYSGCTVAKQEKCTVKSKGAKAAGEITTNALKTKAAFETKAAAEKESESYVVVFEPKEGKNFVTLELAGTCTVSGEVTVEGSTSLKVVTLGAAETEEVEGPEKALTEVFTNNGGKTEAVKTELKFAGLKATYTGKVKNKLSTKEKFGGMV